LPAIAVIKPSRKEAPTGNDIYCLYRFQEHCMATRKSTSAGRTAAKAPTQRAAAKRPAAKATKPAPKAPAAAEAGAAAKPKHKLVRDSFTIPKAEYTVLGALKERAAGLKRPTKKSEILRAGISALRAMTDAALLAALNAVPSLKTGRPKGVKAAVDKAAAAKKKA
jgi:hypothetical protein